MLGLATKKNLEDLEYRVCVEMRDDRGTVALHRVAVDNRTSAIREKQREIIEEVLATDAKLDAINKRQAGIEVALQRRLVAADLNDIAAKLHLLLAHLGLEAVQRPAQEAGWELRECEEVEK